MTEQFDFPRELRCDAVMLAKSHPYTADMLGRAAVEIERLHTLISDACKVLDHYDLPEHAFHYRRAAATPSPPEHPEGT